MKRYMFLLGLCCLALPALAETRLGLIGGSNFSDMNVSPSDPSGSFNTRTNWVGGLTIDVDLSTRVALQFQPMYIRKGADFVLQPDAFFEGGVARISTSYVELPVLLQVSLGNGRLEPYIIAGPTAAALLEAKVSAEGMTEDVKDSFEDWDFGVAGGVGLRMPLGKASTFVEGRYTYGLANVGKDTAEGERVSNRGFQVLLGVTVQVGER